MIVMEFIHTDRPQTTQVRRARRVGIYRFTWLPGRIGIMVTHYNCIWARIECKIMCMVFVMCCVCNITIVLHVGIKLWPRLSTGELVVFNNISLLSCRVLLISA